MIRGACKIWRATPADVVECEECEKGCVRLCVFRINDCTFPLVPDDGAASGRAIRESVTAPGGRNPVQAKNARFSPFHAPRSPISAPLRPIEHLPVTGSGIAVDMGEGPSVGGTPIPHAQQDVKKISRGERKARKKARRLALKPSTTSPVPHPKQDGKIISQGERKARKKARRLAFKPSTVAEDGMVRTNGLP